MVIWQEEAHLAPLRLERKYLAQTNQGFLLQETSQLATLILEGEVPARIREMVLTDNLFQLRATASRKTTLGAIMTRLKGAPETLLELLVSGSVDSRRLTNLYLVLLKHRLLRDFVSDVVLEQQQRLLNHVPGTDVRAFFSRKQDEVPEIGAWSEATLAKAQRNILTLLTQAGVLVKNDASGWDIQASYVPTSLRDVITAEGHGTLLPLLMDPGNHV